MEQRPQVRLGFPDVLRVVVVRVVVVRLVALAKNFVHFFSQPFLPIFRNKMEDVLRPIKATF